MIRMPCPQLVLHHLVPQRDPATRVLRICFSNSPFRNLNHDLKPFKNQATSPGNLAFGSPKSYMLHWKLLLGRIQWSSISVHLSASNKALKRSATPFHSRLLCAWLKFLSFNSSLSSSDVLCITKLPLWNWPPVDKPSSSTWSVPRAATWSSLALRWMTTPLKSLQNRRSPWCRLSKSQIKCFWQSPWWTCLIKSIPTFALASVSPHSAKLTTRIFEHGHWRRLARFGRSRSPITRTFARIFQIGSFSFLLSYYYYYYYFYFDYFSADFQEQCNSKILARLLCCLFVWKCE